MAHDRVPEGRSWSASAGTRRRRGRPASSGRPLVVALAVCVVLGGCSTDAATKGAAVAVGRPTPTPTPEPTTDEPPAPVRGVVTVRTVDASEPTRLGFPEDADPDQAVATAVATDVAGAIDRHLTALQEGGEDLAGLAALWTAEDEETLATVTAALASPDVPVDAAAYDVTVLVEAAPTIAVVTATVQRADDTTVVVDLVFDVTGDRPVLQLVGAGRDPTQGDTADASASQEEGS